jgi:hypothetical protein
MIIWSLGLRILPRFPDFEWLGTGDFVTISPVEDKPRRRKGVTTMVRLKLQAKREREERNTEMAGTGAPARYEASN